MTKLDGSTGSVFRPDDIDAEDQIVAIVCEACCGSRGLAKLFEDTRVKETRNNKRHMAVCV